MDELRAVSPGAASMALNTLRRSELQKLAKECGLKANTKSLDIITKLEQLLSAERQITAAQVLAPADAASDRTECDSATSSLEKRISLEGLDLNADADTGCYVPTPLAIHQSRFNQTQTLPATSVVHVSPNLKENVDPSELRLRHSLTSVSAQSHGPASDSLIHTAVLSTKDVTPNKTAALPPVQLPPSADVDDTDSSPSDSQHFSPLATAAATWAASPPMSSPTDQSLPRPALVNSTAGEMINIVKPLTALPTFNQAVSADTSQQSPGLLAEARKMAEQVRTECKKPDKAVPALDPASVVKAKGRLFDKFQAQGTPSRLGLAATALTNRLRSLVTPGSGKSQSEGSSGPGHDSSPGNTSKKLFSTSKGESSPLAGRQQLSDLPSDRGASVDSFAAEEEAARAATEAMSPAGSLCASGGGTPGGAEAALSAAMMSSMKARPAFGSAALSPGLLTMSRQQRNRLLVATEDEAAAAYASGARAGEQSLRRRSSTSSGGWRGATEKQLREMERGWDVYKANSPGWVAPSPATVRMKSAALSAAGFTAAASPSQPRTSHTLSMKQATKQRTGSRRLPLGQQSVNVVAGRSPGVKGPGAKASTAASLARIQSVTKAAPPRAAGLPDKGAAIGDAVAARRMLTARQQR